jgi:uncharacterized protein YprB with RNaseH-like and TPR domain
MIRIFFDIETYSPGLRPTYDDKIIAIAYKTEDSEVTVLKEWESDEKQILTRFLDDIKEAERPNLIGHNILRFDIPLIINRASDHGLGPTGELMRLLLDAYPIDTIQALLPTNGFYFKNLGLTECARRIGAETKSCQSSEIKTRYEEGDYDAITEHIAEDVLTTEKLFNYLAQGG